MDFVSVLELVIEYKALPKDRNGFSRRIGNAFREIAPSVRGRLTAFNEPGNTMERTLMTPAARPFFIV